MKKLLFCLAIFALLAAPPVYGAEKSASELRLIVQAGGSLVIDLEKIRLGVSELAMLASNLKYNSTLAIKMAPGKSLTGSQCAQIARESPGHVIFWF